MTEENLIQKPSQCTTCRKSINSDCNVCPSCGTRVTPLRHCPGCNKRLEETWKTCPYCGAAIIDGARPSASIKDSVVKELNQTQQTDIHQVKGAEIGGGINFNIGSHNQPLQSGTNELQYEEYVMAILRAGGILDRARGQLEQRRAQLGLSLKQRNEIESTCLAEVGRESLPSAREPQNQKLTGDNLESAKTNTSYRIPQQSKTSQTETPNIAPKNWGKNKSTAVLLAIFLDFWTWLYLYKKCQGKFWVNLVLTIVTAGFWLIIAWIWAIIDTATKPDSWYETY